MPEEKDTEGAGATISCWRQSTPSVLAEGGRDIRAENKKAIKKGITSSKALNEFRRDGKNQIRERAREAVFIIFFSSSGPRRGSPSPSYPPPPLCRGPPALRALVR